MTEEKNKVVVEDEPMTPIPDNNRQSWITPATIVAGCEFCVPVLMVGATLIGSFGLKGMIPVVLFAFLALTWIGNSLNGYMGAKTGLSSSVIARQDFGDKQAKFIIAMVIGVVSMGWWAIQTATTGNALCAVLGIDYNVNRTAWAAIAVIVGLLFAIPSIIGYSSMKWTDYFAVPCGLILCVGGVYLALRNIGFHEIINYQGNGEISFAVGVSAVLGLNVSQFVISADYTRYAKAKWKDNILIPLGVIVVGIPLVVIGGVMAVGHGTADIVAVMQYLGFPTWGFLVLWLASWTSQLVNNYTMGLSFSNIINVRTNKGRAVVTFAATIVSICLALWGILDHFTSLLNLASLLYPPIAAVMFVGFFVRKEKWSDNIGWNFMATIAMIAGVVAGYVTTYVVTVGIPPLQSLIVTAIVYYFAMKIKAKVAPDKFTEGMFE